MSFIEDIEASYPTIALAGHSLPPFVRYDESTGTPRQSESVDNADVVALIRCGAGHFHLGSPLGLRPDVLKDPSWIYRVAQQLVDQGYRRILISRPEGRYPGTPMTGASWHACHPMIRDEVLRTFEIIPEPGIYGGSAFYADNESGEFLPWSMGIIGSYIVNPLPGCYEIAHNNWFVNGCRHLWVDATSPYAKRENFIRWANGKMMHLGKDYEVVGEAWPLAADKSVDPTIASIPWVCSARFIQPYGAGTPKRFSLSPTKGNVVTRLYIALTNHQTTDITEEDIVRAGATPVRYI